jgi:GNAT superfamily N-acetyltransferase
MKSPCLLKLASLDDVPEILKMIRDFHFSDHISYDAKIVRKIINQLIRDPDLGKLWKIEYSKKLAGYAVITLGYSIEYLGKCAFVDELYLKKEFRGLGLGTIAVNILKRNAKKLGAKTLLLEVERRNKGAVHLYRNLHFKDTDRLLMAQRLL